MYKVELKKDLSVGGVNRKKGDIVKVSSSIYKDLLSKGDAVKYSPKKEKKD